MPKRRSPTGNEADSAPRRSSRVSSKPTPTVQAAKIPKSKKPTKQKSSSTQKSKQDPKEDHAQPEDNSLSPLSEPPSSDKELEEEQAPLKKKLKLDSSNSTTAKSSTGKKDQKQKTLTVGEVLKESILLKNQDDEEVDVLELVKEKGAVIFLYPKANTPGCTTQACGYRDIYQDIADTGFQVFGLSMDSPKSQKNWQQKQKLPYSLLCDPKQNLIRILGGSKSSTQVQRSHYIFEAGGKLINITSPASTKNSPQEALDFIKSV